MNSLTELKNNLLIQVDEISGVGEVRRIAVRLAQKLGFSEVETERAAIVTTEAVTNLIKYAGTGQILFRELENNGLEILIIDQGPGIRNPGEALKDGFSTGSTPGGGLGAIRRLSTVFQIHSQLEKGTAILSQLWTPGKYPGNQSFETGVMCLTHPREIVCGDGWTIRDEGNLRQICVIDGLGHGDGAAQCAAEAKRLLSEQEALRSPAETLQVLHQGLRHTRGAAVAVIEIEKRRRLRFAGVGNIGGVVFTLKGQKHLVSHNGIIGHEARKIVEFAYEWEPDALLVVHTDGLQSRWNLLNYSGLSQKHPALIAGVLYRDFKRGYDDVTVLAIKEKG